jgi:hypothetical protein
MKPQLRFELPVNYTCLTYPAPLLLWQVSASLYHIAQ